MTDCVEHFFLLSIALRILGNSEKGIALLEKVRILYKYSPVTIYLPVSAKDVLEFTIRNSTFGKMSHVPVSHICCSKYQF